jgi:hypothetical protein
MDNCVLCLPQFALGEGTTKAEPSTVKGNFLLFDKGVIPQSQVTVYSAFVRTPAEYNNIHELEKIVKPMMNVKVGKEHGVFCAVADDPGKGVLIGLVYFHERVRPLLATDVAITKISWADVDYELPDRELVEGLHPALLGAANAMDEWVEEVPLTRKEKEVRAQARAQAATTSADEAAKAAAEAADAASIEASKNAKAKAAEERAAATKAAAELAERNAPTDPGPLASWDAVEKLKKMALVNALKFHNAKFGEHEKRPQLVIKLCAKLKIKKEAARVESKRSSRKRDGGGGGSSGDKQKADDDDDELDDDPEIALEKARIEKATKKLKVLGELRKQADELERSVAAAGPAPSGAAAGPAPSGASTAIVAGATGVSPGKAIANGDMPYRDLARGATHIYERGAFDGATVNISGASSDLSAMMGGGSAFMRQSSRPDYATPSPMLTASSSSSGSMGPYVGHTHDAHIAAAAASIRRQQQERAHHGQQQQQQQHQWPQQTHWPQQPPPPPPPPPPGPCGFY